LASGDSSSRAIRLHDLATGQELHRFPGHAGWIGLAFSPDSKAVASAGDSDDGTFELWSVATGQRLQQFKGAHQAIRGLVFSPDGRLLATAGFQRGFMPSGNWVQLWDVASGRALRRLTGINGANGLAFSPDGKTLTAAAERAVQLWEVATGQPRRRLEGHQGTIWAVAFSPDGSRLASASQDTTVLVWDLTDRHGQPPAEVSRQQLEALWQDLAGEDAGKAWRAVWTLAAAPGQAVPWCRQHLEPVRAIEPETLARRIADLGDARFATRKKAMEDLEKWGEAAEPALRQALAGTPPLETRQRLEQLMQKLEVPAGEGLRHLRALEVLEHCGTAEAQQVLENLAHGLSDAQFTREAKACCAHLTKRPLPVTLPREEAAPLVLRDLPVAREVKPLPLKAEALTFRGKVLDKETRQPLAGATVVIRWSLLNVDTHTIEKVLSETSHTTDREGHYQFTLSPELVARPGLYVECEASHPEYAPTSPSGYDLAALRREQKLGEQPFFSTVRLRRGKAITGQVVTPDGTPAAGVPIQGYAAEPGEYGSWLKGHTDDQGHFRLMATRSGGAFLIVQPEAYAPVRLVLGDKRGDVGRIVLRPGVRLSGRVLDSQGRPLAGCWVNATEETAQPQAEFMQRVAHQIHRSAQTDAHGRFVLGPLVAGSYQVEPQEYRAEGFVGPRSRQPLAALFLSQGVTLSANGPPATVEFKAVPHVTVAVQFLDSKGPPCAGNGVMLVGDINGTTWIGNGRTELDGLVTVRAPRGVENACLQFTTTGAVRCQRSKAAPLSGSRVLELGTLHTDIKGILVHRYTAPLLLVKVSSKEGSRPDNIEVTGTYIQGQGFAGQARHKLIWDVTDGIIFHKQADGRFRGAGLLPDEKMRISARAEGYRVQARTVQLPEGAAKELELVLEK
jgi:hypothetical protein